MTGSTPSPEPMPVSRAQMGRTGPPMSYARGPTRQRGRRRSSRPDRRREPERCIALEPDLRDRVRIEGTDSGRIRVARATGAGTNCLRRARLFSIQKPGTTDPNGHAIGDPLGDREVRGAELALDGKPGARLDGYQMLWMWTRGCLISPHSSPMSQDIVHSSNLEVAYVRCRPLHRRRSRLGTPQPDPARP